MSVKLLALAASYRPQSLNRHLLSLMEPLAIAAGAQVTHLDYAELDAPIYRADGAALPPGALKFAEALLSHHGILLASPEYNWSIPGGLKNLIDWMSVDPRNPLQGKTALLVCASPSGRGGISGLQQLRVPLEVLGTWIYPNMIGIGQYSGTLTGKDQQHLHSCITDFITATGALAHAR